MNVFAHGLASDVRAHAHPQPTQLARTHSQWAPVLQDTPLNEHDDDDQPALFIAPVLPALTQSA